MMLISNITQNQVDLGKQLLEACRNGNTEEVKSLMQSGAAFTTDWMGTSPLHFAAQYGHVEVLDVLLKAGVSRDTRTKVDLTPLHLAAQGGHLEIVSQLVQHGADIEAKDLLKMTPLHWAVQRGYFDIVECLLMNGADPNAVSKFDKTPLDIAYDVGYLDMVPILQRYTSASPIKPRKESKSTPSPANSKSRPIVLPNKAIRTPKIVHKPIATAQIPTSSSGNSLTPSIKTIRLADGTHTVKSVTSSSLPNSTIQKVILPKGNLNYDTLKKIIDCSNPDSLSKIIIKAGSPNNNNNCIKDEHPLLTGKPLVINARTLDHESCKKELEETKSKMQEFKSMVDRLKCQLDEKDKSISEMVIKTTDLNSKIDALKEENVDLKKKLEKATGTLAPPATTPSSARKETRSTTNQQSQQNNQNTSPIKTRGVRVQVKNKKLYYTATFIN